MFLLKLMLIISCCSFTFSLLNNVHIQRKYSLQKLNTPSFLISSKSPILKSLVPKSSINSLVRLEQSNSNNVNDSDSPNDPLLNFVAFFFAAWALGYSALSYVEVTGGGLGDVGGYIGAGFAVVLILTLLGATLYEVFKPE